MNIRPIRSQADYERALDEIECLMDAHPGSMEEAELEALGALVEAYEERVYPVPNLTSKLINIRCAWGVN